MKTMFDSVPMGPLRLKNRLLRSATMEGAADEQGNLRDSSLYDMYEQLAQGEVSAIITGMVGVDENSQVLSTMIRAYKDEFITQFRPVFDMAHSYDCKVIVQISHCGAKAMRDQKGGMRLAPSAIALDADRPAREMTKEEIARLKHSFAHTAVNCKKAGADGVQIHGAHGYLLSQFLSPVFNQRTDEYGGSIENRGRIILEVYEAIREAVGEQFPIWIKLNGTDLVEKSITPEEFTWLCKELARRGIDAIEVSGGLSIDSLSGPSQPNILQADKEGSFSAQAAALAEQIDTPIISVGGYRTPEAIETWLNKSKIDAIAFCRPLICEPGLVRRWKDGDRTKSLCISCNKCKADVACHLQQ